MKYFIAFIFSFMATVANAAPPQTVASVAALRAGNFGSFPSVALQAWTAGGTAAGNYTQIGRFFSADFTVACTSTTGMVGNVAIGALPSNTAFSGSNFRLQATLPVGTAQNFPVPPTLYRLTAGQTVYMPVNAVFTGGADTACRTITWLQVN